MLTACPKCSTTFRVTPVQLKARSGKVRCGQCHAVFNALDTLVEDAFGVAAEAAAAKSDRLEVRWDESDFDVLDIGETGARQGTVTPRTGPQGVGATTPVAETATHGPEEIVEASPLTDYLAAAAIPVNHQPSTMRWPWVVASVLAATGLLAQAIYYYRVEIAVLRPDIRPLLLSACRPLHCDVPHPRSVDALSIESSDLHPEPQQPGRLTLAATLRSRAIYPLEWPMLELTLTDVADRKQVVRDFAARDYLPGKADLTAGFPANSEVTVNMSLDVGDLSAAGYRLYVFYP